MKIQEITPKSINYDEAYNAANPAQKKAIDHTEGTVLVVAGPGTGKTQIIAARIANIIKQGNKPDIILCLTYTDAGTIAMRERLLQFIGPTAYRVKIFTFHAFCNLVIQDNPNLFGYSDLRPASELEQREFVKQMLDSLPLENPLAKEKGDLYNDCKKLLNLYATIKREDWDIAEKCAAIESHIELLPNSPDMHYKRKTTRDGVTYNAGDLMQHKLDAEIRKFERTKAALQSYPLYQQILADKGRYDFDDMILWIIRAFKEDYALLSDYQERFQYVLVDEYQDTSTSQNEIIDLLMGFWEDPNLFVVGDDDQSIYRFQGASVANILEFTDRYQPALVTLTHNYRSSQQILKAAQALIGNNSQRLANKELYPQLDIEKNLTAAKPDAERPMVRVFPNNLQESLAIGMELEELHRSGVDLSKIAVLYHNHKQADELIAYLTATGTPYSTRKRQNVLTDPFCSNLITILKYLDAEYRSPHSEEGALFRILHFPLFNLDPLEIARLFAGNHGEKRQPIRHIMRKNPIFQQVSQFIESTLSNIEAVTIQELVHGVITRLGMLGSTESCREAIWQLEVLNTFFDFVKEESGKVSGMSLIQLVAMVDSMLSQDIQLPAQRIAVNSAGVNLITTHSSKGLEFDTVYLMGCTESFWEGKRTQTDFALPPAMTTCAEGDDDEELRRLFFVAMTRAERKLVISYAEKNNNDKVLAKSRFVAELEQSGTVTVSSCQLEDDELQKAMELVFKSGEPDMESVFTSDFVGELLQNYQLSYSHLNQYLECPKTFFYSNILRIPTPNNPATAFGIAAHDSLEFLFLSMKESPTHAFPPREAFLDFFERQMHKQRDAFTEIEFQRRLESGLKSMGQLYDENIDRWHIDVLIERSFDACLDDEIRLVGRVDKLEILHGSLVDLVDYKTGKYDKKKFQRPNPEKVTRAENEGKTPKTEDLFGGTYWRQAVFYKLLLDNCPVPSFNASAANFCFVEPDATSGKFMNHTVEIEPDDMDFVRGLIETTYRSILNREFNKGCGKSYCQWCGKG